MTEEETGESSRRIRFEPDDIEAFVRPVFGIYIAIAFGIIFHSLFLGLLAGAFLVYMPRLRSMEDMAGIQMINKIYFLVIMMVIVFMAFNSPGTLGLGLDMGASILTPWEWNTNAIIFMGVWLIAFVTGLLADLESRQIVGVITIAICFVIFTMGVGAEEVGYAFFGAWWPQMHNSVSGLFEPVQDFLATMKTTFGDAFSMLTNPVGYASQIMNGTYVDNPTGATGAFGVELKGMDIDQIYTEKPFTITVMIKNEGAFEAKNVNLKLNSTLPIKSTTSESKWIPMEAFELDGSYNRTIVSGEQSFVQQDSRQEVFFFNNMSCSTVNKYNLRERYLPFRATVSYDYQVDSSLEVEFVDTEEWNRLVRENKINTAPVASKISSSPVRLNLGTLDQPIREGTPFHLALKIEAAHQASHLDRADIFMKIPKVFIKDSSIVQNPSKVPCTPHPPERVFEEGDKYVFEWPLFCYGEYCTRSNTIYCRFDALDISKPTETFLVYANSTYRISSYIEAESSLQFGDAKC